MQPLSLFSLSAVAQRGRVILPFVKPQTTQQRRMAPSLAPVSTTCIPKHDRCQHESYISNNQRESRFQTPTLFQLSSRARDAAKIGLFPLCPFSFYRVLASNAVSIAKLLRVVTREPNAMVETVPKFPCFYFPVPRDRLNPSGRPLHLSRLSTSDRTTIPPTFRRSPSVRASACQQRADFGAGPCSEKHGGGVVHVGGGHV